ncbi:MAG: hypothetical protein KF894_14055 [Labilithrix sp.]|nr:hypothetical protein [Labilithrix sp.]
MNFESADVQPVPKLDSQDEVAHAGIRLGALPTVGAGFDVGQDLLARRAAAFRDVLEMNGFPRWLGSVDRRRRDAEARQHQAERDSPRRARPKHLLP